MKAGKVTAAVCLLCTVLPLGAQASEPRVPLNSEKVDMMAITLGGWVKKFLDAIRATPDEHALRSSYIQLREKQRQLSESLVDSNKKIEEQRQSLQRLQSKLKEAKTPALPAELSRREVFAAGMAAGYRLNAMLEAQHELGIELPKEDFIAGLTEAMSDGRQLPQGEYQLLLASIADRAARAEHIIQQQREMSDSLWKTEFSRKPDSKESKEGVWYQVIWSGDRGVGENENRYISISRKRVNGAALDDAVLSEEILNTKEEKALPLLKEIIDNLHVHGEAIIAMPVDIHGTPYLKGPFIEEWRVRITDADLTNNQASLH